LKLAKELLGPKIRELLKQSDASVWEPQVDNADDLNILSWLSSMTKGRDRDPDVISHVLVLVALASIHTTLLRMVNVLYDVPAAGPSLQNDLLNEINSIGKGKWETAAYDQLYRLDSVLRESQRISPPTTLGLKRLFLEPYTFENGTHIPAGTYVCMPIHAIENDEKHTPHPDEYDGLRTFRARQEKKRNGDLDNAAAKDLLFTTPTRTVLNFGYGKTACPGRFFASVVIKMVLVKMLTEYDFAFMPGTKRPAHLMAHEFLFTWPWQKMLVRRKKGGACPF
jgi:ent-kaurene oxidase